MNGPHLVDTPDATKFRAKAKLGGWHEVWFGSPKKMPKEVHPFMKRASDALHDGLSKVEGLATDPTRTPTVRHHDARIVAEKTIATILENKGKQEAAGHAMMAEANEAINAAFVFDTSRSPIYERIIGFINANANTPQKIRDAMKQDPQVVTVLSSYPPYVFDLADDTVRKIATEGWMHHTPEAADKLLQGQAVVTAAAGYDRAVKGIRESFYNDTIATQAANRVEV